MSGVRGDFTKQEVNWLLSGRCNLASAGEVQWRDKNRNYRADLAVTAMGFTSEDLSLCYRIGKKSASEPTILLLLRGVSVLRLDVNGNHNDVGKQYVHVTHLQRATTPGAPESFEPNPPDISPVPLGVRVGGDTYRQILVGFAAVSSMNLRRVTWANPPEGRQP